MRNIVLILSFIIGFISLSNAQNKIILKKGLRRHILKKGKTLGITQKNENFIYSNWKNICQNRENLICNENIWTIDSILEKYIIIKRIKIGNVAYKYDTIPKKNRALRKIYKKEWEFVKQIDTINNSKNEQLLVFRTPTSFIRKKIMYDNINSLTFAEHQDCNGFSIFVPLASLMSIIMVPIVTIEKGVITNPFLLVVGEIVAITIGYLIYRKVVGNFIKTYDLNEWEVKVKAPNNK